jgi:hypothetical protein
MTQHGSVYVWSSHLTNSSDHTCCLSPDSAYTKEELAAVSAVCYLDLHDTLKTNCGYKSVKTSKTYFR